MELMRRTYPYCPFERYADDTVIHCKTEAQARYILDKVNERMRQCRLELHPQKTKMNREVHVRFRESLRVKLPLATRLRGRGSLSPSYSIVQKSCLSADASVVFRPTR